VITHKRRRWKRNKRKEKSEAGERTGGKTKKVQNILLQF
jgi:hypothetical protein